MKAIKKRPRNATPRKPVPKPRAKAAPRKPAPRKKVEQRRLVIRFSEPGDVDWLGAQATRLGLGDGKGAGAATYAKMLIRAAHECSTACATDPLDLLRGVESLPPPGYKPNKTLRPPSPDHPDYVDRVVYPPEVAENDGEPVDVDDLVGRLAEQVEPQQREAPHHQEQEPGRVRVMGARVQRRPLDWGGR